MRKSIVFVVFAFFTVSSNAQWWLGEDLEQVELTQLGVAINVAATMNTGAFTLAYAPTCCLEYSGSLGISPSLSVFVRQEIVKSLRLQLRGSFIPQNATFETDESILFSNAVLGTSRHTLETKMSWVGAEFLIDYKLAGGLRVMAGASAGTYMGATFSQREEMIIPNLGTFENGKRIRNESSNVDLINQPSPVIGIVGGLGYDIPVTANHSVVLTPEFYYTYNLGNVVDGTNWKASTIRAGVALAFSLNPPVAPLPIEFKTVPVIDSIHIVTLPSERYRRVAGEQNTVIDTAVIEDIVWITSKVYQTDTVYSPELPKINAKLSVKSVAADGSIRDNFKINVKTQFVEEALPLLPVVFFDPQSVSLSFRYNQVSNTAGFSEDNLAPRTTTVHREVLNVIGRRMVEQPSTTIRLRGFADPSTENSDCSLATKRSSAVKEYLVRTWSISEDRIVVSTGSSNCAPDRPTRQPSEEGYSENRRVDIETDNLSLISPVRKRKFNEPRTIDPPQIMFDPTGSSTQYVENWVLQARSGGDVLFSDSGRGVPQISKHAMTITMAEKLAAGEPIQVELKINGIRGVVGSTQAEIPVSKDTMRTEIERLTLTLFNVASDAITPISEQQIQKFVENVPSGSTVVVRGYADMLGNADFNRKLSASRAQSVCSAIKKHLKKKVTLNCDEIATDRFPPGIDSYKTPEERFLSRTVQIEVKKFGDE